MIALQVIPDRFAAQAEKLKNSLASGRDPVTRNHIRRMTRGIVLKEDTFATLRLVAGNGENKRIVDAGSRMKDGQEPMTINGKRATDIYSNFLLQQVSEERVEKSQIIETFGEPYIFLFGERARVMTFTGVLANTFDFNWEAEWWHNYEHYLRGTRAVESDARVFLSFDTTLVGGYIISCAATKVSEQRNFVQFQFQLFVTSYANFSDIGNPDAAPPGSGAFLSKSKSGTAEGALDEAASSVFRPKLLSDYGRVPLNTSGLKIGSGALQDDINFDSMVLGDEVRAAMDFISQVWSEGSRIASKITRGVGDAVTGARVRVPIGFEGTLAFDEGANVHLVDVYSGRDTKITYTTFDDNDDEYVGASDHYGSSSVELQHLNSLTSPTIESELTRSQQMVERAESIWKQHGLEIPDSKQSTVSTFLVSKGLGLVGVGATKSWTAAASPGGPLNPEGRLPLSILGDTGVRENTETPE